METNKIEKILILSSVGEQNLRKCDINRAMLKISPNESDFAGIIVWIWRKCCGGGE